MPHVRPGECLITLSRARGAPRFGAFPAEVERSGKAAVLRLDHREARHYRTALREGIKADPNFAGHFSIVAWGCGSSCTDFAVVDRTSGRVVFPQAYRSIFGGHVGDDAPAALGGLNSLRFRRDSRLLVVPGAPLEDERREGAAYLEWIGGGFRLVRWIPAKALCLPAD
jgi:hypothetical protein